MIGALGTTLLFACNAIFANRSAKLLGSTRANLARLAVAVVLLGAWAHLAGQGLGGAALPWFLLSGLVGFGIGGVAMFQALPRLGSPLAMLIVQCGSALVAAAGERAWLGTQLTVAQLGLITVTLLGVALGLMPRSLPELSRATLQVGAAWAFLSAAGQGFGAVLSRKAFRTAFAAGEFIDAPTSAYQRALAGLCVAAIAVALGYVLHRRTNTDDCRAESPDPAAPTTSRPRSAANLAAPDRSEHEATAGSIRPSFAGPPDSAAPTTSRPRSAANLAAPNRSEHEATTTPARLLTAGSGDPALHSGAGGRAWPWVFANALCGPVLGVTCFQWALSTTPAGIVQSIVATAPLVTIPLAMALEHSRPRALYYAGAILAVAGVAGLFLVR